MDKCGVMKQSRTDCDDMSDMIRCAEQVQTIEDFKSLIRDKVRPLLPHRALACGCGHVHAAGFAMDYVVTVDYPLEHLAAIRNRAGGIDTPILRRWFQTGEPVLFDAQAPWPGVSEHWLANFRRYRLRNALVHGVYDQERCVGTYFSFHRLPKALDVARLAILSEITPVLHETLLSVIGKLRLSETPSAIRLGALGPREREVSQWVGQGKTNQDIARMLGLSENTVKHHVSSILKKAGVSNRVQLASLMAERDRQSHQPNGTKVL